MTQDEIIEMAKKAGFKHPNPHDGYMGLAYDKDEIGSGSSLETFAKLIAAKEHEAIIDLVAFYGGSVDLEAAIRARGET